MERTIKVEGAREHNLKNINFEIPRNKLTSIIGVSGSGKSTIAFDIIFSEGQRQYFESVSAYARSFLKRSNRPDVDTISGLSPTIIIEQKVIRASPRSTVGTVTEFYNYLRLLYSRVGKPSLNARSFSFNTPLGACPKCKGLGRQLDVNVKRVIDFDKSLNEGAVLHRTWKTGSRYWNIIRASDYFDMNKKIRDFTKEELDLLLYAPPKQLQNKQPGYVQTFSYEGIISRLIKRGTSLHRAIKGYDRPFFQLQDCSECKGGRLNQKALSVLVNNRNIGDVANMQLAELSAFIKEIKQPQAAPIVPRMVKLLNFLIDVGLGYLSLNRSVETLSAGEAQRVKLARQLGSDLVETIYILDEPTIGLHPRDMDKIVDNLRELRDSQNTVIVVEHDPSVILASDHVLEVGPGAGRFGGEVVASGTPTEISKNPKSVTGPYLSGKRLAAKKVQFRKPSGYLEIRNASLHNLKNISVKVPKGTMTALTGVSGAGKSSLVEAFVKEHYDKLVVIDQSPVGTTPRGNPATYVGAFDLIRDIFAKENKVSKSFFSPNSKGACPECKGLGHKNIEMQFLGEVHMICEVCQGKRYLPEVLQYKMNGKNISEVLGMTVQEANNFFAIDELNKKLSLLEDVGLGYLELGQPLDTLSGGEAQRIKLAKNLAKKGEFYVLDEPTKGLHMIDIEKLLALLNRLVDNGNSVLVVEHNLDVIRNADWIIDLGPEGGNKGGQIVAEGTPDQIAKVKESHTGRYLKL
jgi:excinuclease UvrABC ATPase subunit